MNYIIFDLEFNQNYNDKTKDIPKSKSIASSKLPFEIIQIGAIKINENFETISTFNSLVKPIVHKTIHPYVNKITGITEDYLLDEPEFLKVYEDFIKFIGDSRDSILCVWGTVDIKELLRNIKFYNLSEDVIPLKYIDIQYHASKYFGVKNKTRVGLKNAIELLNLKISGDFHNAYNDAYYTCEVFKKIYTPSMKALVYNTSTSPRTKKKSSKKIK